MIAVRGMNNLHSIFPKCKENKLYHVAVFMQITSRLQAPIHLAFFAWIAK